MKERARKRAARAPLYLIEELETRVLLDGGAGQSAYHFLPLGLPPTPAAIASMPQAFVGDLRDAYAANRGIGNLSGAQPDSSGLVHVRVVGSIEPQMVVLVEQSASRGAPGSNSSSINDATSSDTSDLSFTKLVSPALLLSASAEETSTTADLMPAVADLPGFGPVVASQTSAEPVVQSGPGFFTASGDPYASNLAGPGWPGVPDQKHLDFTGTLDPGQPTVTIQIPIGSAPQFMGLSLREAGNDGESADVNQLALVNSMGVTLQQFGPTSGLGPMSLQGMMVYLRNAPPGGHLDVQVAAVGTATEPESQSQTISGVATAPSQAPSWNVSFVLDVQKQDAVTPTQETAGAIQSAVSIGTLIVATPPQNVTSFNSSSSSSPAESDNDNALAGPTATTAVAVATPATSEPEVQSSEGFDSRIATGPLASRSAGPLGPTLASFDAEPTQPVDRHERALSQEIDGLGSSDGVQTAAWRARNPDQEPPSFPGGWLGRSTDAAGADEPVVAVTGRGGYPLKVTSTGHNQRAGLTELWATLPSPSDISRSDSAPAAPKIALYQVSLDPDPESPQADPVECPDFVRAACGLAIGVGLTSSPLFPDLIAALPRRIPTWLVAALRERARRNPDAGAPSKPKSSRLPVWLTSFFR